MKLCLTLCLLLGYSTLVELLLVSSRVSSWTNHIDSTDSADYPSTTSPMSSTLPPSTSHPPTDATLKSTPFTSNSPSTVSTVAPTIPNTGCVYFLSNSGSLWTPNFPLNYPNSIDCLWYLETSSKPIFLLFQTFQTEACCDFVTVYESWTTSGAILIYERRGIHSPFTVNSTNSNKLLVHFHSDYSLSAKGFQAFFQGAVSTTPSTTEVTTPDYGVECGGYLRNSGNFSSPNYPKNYANNVDCFWYLEVPTNVIIIYFNSFSTEKDHDIVSVYQGWGALNNSLIDQWTGRLAPFSFTSQKATRILVHFHSNNLTTDRGFTAIFHSTGNYLEPLDFYFYLILFTSLTVKLY